MYKNTMYIPTITSWLHSQWQSYIAIKIALWVWLSQQFSFRHRTSNKNNTEYRTSVQKLLCYKHKENSEKKLTQKQFFTVTEIVLNDDQVHWSQNSNNKLNLILDIFMRTDVTQTANTALQRYSDSKTILVIVPLQKFRITWQRSYYERSQ